MFICSAWTGSDTSLPREASRLSTEGNQESPGMGACYEGLQSTWHCGCLYDISDVFIVLPVVIEAIFEFFSLAAVPIL